METGHRRSRFTLYIDVFNVLILLYVIGFVAVTALPIPQLLHNEISPVHFKNVDKLVVSSSVTTRYKVNHHKLNPDSNLYVKRAIYARESQAFPAVTENEPYTHAVEDDEKAISQVISYNKVIPYSPPPKGLSSGGKKGKRSMSKGAFAVVMAGMFVGIIWLVWALMICPLVQRSELRRFLPFPYLFCLYFFCCCRCIPDESCCCRKRKKRRKKERSQSIAPHELTSVSALSSTRTEAVAEVEQDTPTRHETVGPLERTMQEISQMRDQTVVDEVDQSARPRGREISLMPSISDTSISGPSLRLARPGSISPSTSASALELPRPASISDRAQSTPPSYLNLYLINYSRRTVSRSRDSPQRLENETDAGTGTRTGSGSSGGGGGHLQTMPHMIRVPDLTSTGVSAQRSRKKVEKPPPYEEVEPGPPDY